MLLMLVVTYIFEDQIVFTPLGLKGHILVTLNLHLMFFFVNDCLLYSSRHGYFFWFHVIVVNMIIYATF